LIDRRQSFGEEAVVAAHVPSDLGQTRKSLSYVLITPARNEALNIERLILSVVRQTVLPTRWVIVSDGSTDGTDEIVEGYLGKHPWILFLRMPERRDRHFAAKVACFNAGYERLRALDFDLVGNLDADISFDEVYFQFLLEKCAADARLGVIGTPFVEGGKHYDYRFTSIEHVSGACQLFRRACFEEIGGYRPIRGGGIDWVAVTTARMKGWRTRTFTDKTCVHHRKMGTANVGPLKALFLQGRKDYVFGNHPLWEIFRSIYQTTKRPFLIGGCLLLAGFLAALSKGTRLNISDDLARFVRKEQMQRLRRILYLNRTIAG
jgi:poly-beta-1,6-N-acetyl-D-glucosamine synthase